jgi:hypothetical protein
MKKILILVAVLAVALVTSPAIAKEGFYLGAFVPFNSISGNITSLDSGSGLGFRAGYGFNKYLALEGSVFKTKHDVSATSGGGTVDFSGRVLDLKLNIPVSDRFEPYFLVGGGRYELNGSGTDLTGNGAQAGFGIDVYVYKGLSLNAGMTWRRISFDAEPITLDANVRTFDIGIAYHFL